MDKAEKTVDARGLSCPMPIVKLSQTIKEMHVGQVVEVIASDQSFAPDVEAWCRKTGHELLRIDHSEEKIKAFIKKVK